MTDMRISREALPGDAACVWHVLDVVLAKTSESRDALEESGLDELAEEFNGLVGRVEKAYAVTEEKLAEAIED